MSASFVEAVCEACDLDRPMRHALVLATGEAVTNIIRHAHRDLPGTELTIDLQVAADEVVLTFHDQGDPFDIASVPQLPPGEIRIGGRGVFLLRALMDDVSCRCRGQRGNTLRLVKRRAYAAGPERGRFAETRPGKSA